MPSAIDPTQPPYGNATTPAIRANFTAAKAEIEALQAAAIAPGASPTLIASQNPCVLNGNFTITATGFPPIEDVRSLYGVLTCLTAEGGCAPGDKIRVNFGQNVTVLSESGGIAKLRAQAANLPTILRPDTGATFNPTPANWAIDYYATW